MNDFDKLSKQLNKIADERDNLFEENKVIKENRERDNAQTQKYVIENTQLKASRDELLEWCKAVIKNHSEYFPKMFYSGFQDVIQKAEALK